MLSIVGAKPTEIEAGTPKAAKSGGKRHRASEEEIAERMNSVLSALKGTSENKAKPLSQLADETSLKTVEVKATFAKIKKAGRGEVKMTGSKKDAAWFLVSKG